MAFQIKFGTDGWRGVIAEDYTFDNVRRCAQGFANYMLEQGNQGKWLVVGHDKRFSSEHFAAAVAEVLAGNGFKVHLTDGATPTPVIAYAVVNMKAAGAVNITASHNPGTDNGFKVRNDTGGAIDPEGLKRIEASIPDDLNDVKRKPYAQAEAAGEIVKFDAATPYIEHLTRDGLIDLQPTQRCRTDRHGGQHVGQRGGIFPALAGRRQDQGDRDPQHPQPDLPRDEAPRAHPAQHRCGLEGHRR